MKLIIEIPGWSGPLCVVASYGLNSYPVIKSDSLLFYALNIAGGIFLILYSVSKTAYANTFINVVWVIIAITSVCTGI